jgi:hypothetical protein
VTQKAASPKKETARITLPPEGAKPAMPKATIKMQQTQPLVKQPGASQSSIQAAPMLTTTSLAPAAEPVSDGAVTALAVFALVASLLAAGAAFLAYSASSLAS